MGVAQDFDDDRDQGDGFLRLEAENVVVHLDGEEVDRGRVEYRNLQLATMWFHRTVWVSRETGEIFDDRKSLLVPTAAERSTLNRRPPVFGGERA